MSMTPPLRLIKAPSSYSERYLCDDCTELDTAGGYGPNEVTGGDGLLFNRRDRRYCRRHFDRHWARWLRRRPLVSARLARLELYRSGLLPFGAPPLPKQLRLGVA
jgi:hypothetical protein